MPLTQQDRNQVK